GSLRRLSVQHALRFLFRRGFESGGDPFSGGGAGQAGAAESGDEAGGTGRTGAGSASPPILRQPLPVYLSERAGAEYFPLVPGGSGLFRAADAPALGRNPAVAP